MADLHSRRRRDTSRGFLRPCLILFVALIMIILVVYTFIFNHGYIFNKPAHQTPTVLTDNKEDEEGSAVSEDSSDDPYRFLNDSFSSRQIPLFNRPHLYELKLKLFIPWKQNVSFGEEDWTLDGRIRMHFTVTITNTRLQFHAENLNIGETEIRDDYGRLIPIKEMKRLIPTVVDIWTEHELLEPNNYTLVMHYKTKVNNFTNFGLFAKQIPGKKFIVASHLQTMHARSVFPCVDVPEAKARFETTVLHPKGTTAVHNTKLISSKDSGDFLETKFKLSPTMSTYLFALTVSDYHFLEHISDNNIRNSEPEELLISINQTHVFVKWINQSTLKVRLLGNVHLSLFSFRFLTQYDHPSTWWQFQEGKREGERWMRVYASAEDLPKMQVALDTLEPLLNFYEQYFSIKYPLDKLDIFALPDMKMTAMENWGLITIRQRVAMFNPRSNSPSERTQMLYVIAHEVAHQWFGNIVTMRWWNNLWLNEGFATMIGRKATQAIEKTAVGYDEDSIMDFARVLRLDQVPSGTRAVTVRETDSVNPDDRFNLVAYRKASAIISMTEQILGEDAFQAGLERFLQQFAYSNADHEDLMSVWTYAHDAASGTHLRGQNFSLTDVISTWIYQKGFPILSVRRQSENLVLIKQSSYRHTKVANPEYDIQQWKIPLAVTNPVTKEVQIQWLLENQNVAVDLSEDIVLDPNISIFGRIRYDTETYDIIMQRLRDNLFAIPVAARCRLLDDSYTLAESGRLSYGKAFLLTSILRNEVKYSPVMVFNAHLDFLFSRICTHTNYAVFQSFVISMLSPLYDRLRKKQSQTEWNADKMEETVYTRVCLMGHPDCIIEAKEKVRALMISCKHLNLSDTGCNAIAPHLRASLYATAVMYSEEEDIFEFLLAKFHTETYGSEREHIWNGLSGSKRKNQIYRAWEQLIFVEGPKDNLHQRCSAFTKIPLMRHHFLTFVVENADRIAKAYNGSAISLSIILMTQARVLMVAEDLPYYTKAEAIFAKYAPNVVNKKNSNRITGVLRWKKDYGDYVIGNASEILNMVHEENTKVERFRKSRKLTSTVPLNLEATVPTSSGLKILPMSSTAMPSIRKSTGNLISTIPNNLLLTENNYKVNTLDVVNNTVLHESEERLIEELMHSRL